MSDQVPGDRTSPGALIERARLAPLLELVDDRRLTLVVAGAGFGKTTLIQRWAANRRTAWVSLRDGPSTGATLLEAILKSLAQVDVRLDDSLRGSLAAGAGVATSDAERAEAEAGIIASALHASPGELVLVLDDLQEVATGGGSLVGGLVRQAPPTVHVVVISRTLPGFPIERLRARGELLEIGPAELAFDADEAARLLRAATGDRDEALAKRLEAATRGWPALVRLLVEALRSVPRDERRDAVERMLRSGEALFPYLAEEVIGAESASVRELVATVATLDSFDVGLCTELGIESAADAVEQLRSRGLFLTTAADRPDVLTLHGLIQDYARKRLPLDAGRRSQVRDRYVRWLLARGEAERALGAAIDDQAAGLIREILLAHGIDLVRRGRVEVVLAGSSAIGEPSMVAGLRLVIADAQAYRGDWREAEAALQAEAHGSELLPAPVAWRLARLYFELTEFEKTADVLARVSDEPAAPGDAARVLAWRSLSAWRAGDAAAQDMAAEAVAAAEMAGDAAALSVAETAACYALISTDLTSAHVHHTAALAAAVESGDIVQQIRLRNAGGLFWSLERHIEELTRNLPLAEAGGNLRWLFRTVLSRALALLDLGRLERAETDLRRAIEIAGRLGSGELEPLVFLGELYRIRGDLAQAEAVHRRVLASGTTDPDLAAVAHGGLARIIARTEPEAAREHADAAVSNALAHNRHDTLLAAGWVALAQDRAGDAARGAEQALEAAAAPTTGEDRLAAFAFGLELAAMADDDVRRRQNRLREALAIWQRLGNAAEAAVVGLALAAADSGSRRRVAVEQARRQVASAGIRDSAADAACLLTVLPRDDPPALEIRTLGGFAVRRHGVPVELAEWKSRKPRDLLKLLIAKRGPVTRDELSEALWPDEPLDVTSNRLSVTLSHLRAVLDPERQLSPEAFVARVGDGHQLVTQDLVIDLHDFLGYAREGLGLLGRGRRDEALEQLLAAEATYGGDLFEEDAFADWAVGPREEARATYVQVARGIAEVLAGSGDDDGAARYLMRVLARDAFDESAHIELVRTLARGRHYGEARRAYQAYVARMAELEIEPAPYPTPA